jgi:hypothetical protein
VSEGIDFDHNYGRAVIMFGYEKLNLSHDVPLTVRQRSLPIYREPNPQGEAGVFTRCLPDQGI